MILDVCVGSRKMYHNFEKNLGNSFIGIDIRKGDFSIEKTDTQWAKKEIIIKPTIQADMQYLPFRDNVFDGVIFDPPHLDCGLKSFLWKMYGAWDQTEMIRTTRAANKEFVRVLRPRGFIVLKCLGKQFRIYETLLKNFTFFLPITTYRARGAYGKNFRKSKAAQWNIGYINANNSKG